MKNKILSLFAWALLPLMGGCDLSMEEISKNPNKPVEVSPASVFTQLSVDTFGINFYGISAYQRVWMYDSYVGGGHFNYLRRNFISEYRRVAFSYDMEKEARRTGDDRYLYLSEFFKAFWMFEITRLFGDVPYTEGARGNFADGTFYPAYDDQEDIIWDLLGRLAEANAGLAPYEGTTLAGDILYGGNVHQWRQLINFYRLRILISLSWHDTIKGHQVAGLFAEIAEDPDGNPLMGKLSDSAIRKESDNPGDYAYYGERNFTSSYRVTKYIVDRCKQTGDKRLFKFADVMICLQGKAGVDPQDFANYKGVIPNPGIDSYNNVEDRVANTQSTVNPVWYQSQLGPDTMNMGYPEQEFILAEAALRGWITDNAAVHYQNGVRAACTYRGIAEDDIDTYLAGEHVRLTGSDTEKLGRIITEKYLNFFMQGGNEPYFELRRTGYPAFGEFLERNTDNLYNNGYLPLRYQYPQTEIDNNNENVTAAIRKLDKGDERNSRMWLLQGSDPLFNPDPFPFRDL